jgi:hypothetical protein
MDSSQFMERDRTPLLVMAYGVYLYYCSRSLRLASRCLKPIIRGSHVSTYSNSTWLRFYQETSSRDIISFAFGEVPEPVTHVSEGIDRTDVGVTAASTTPEPLSGAGACQLPDRDTVATVAREFRLLTITSLCEIV